MNLAELLGDQPLLVLAPGTSTTAAGDGRLFTNSQTATTIIIGIRARSNQSWSNVLKAIASLGGRPHDGFGPPNVEASAKSVVRKMMLQTGLSLDELGRAVLELQGR